MADCNQHIPPQGAHPIRYYGWYSNKSRGLRRKAAAAEPLAASGDAARLAAPSRASQTWAMLIKRVYEVDSLACPEYGAGWRCGAYTDLDKGTTMPAGIEIVGEVRDVEVIAAGRGVYVRRYLERAYGKGRWRKMKGRAAVRLADGAICEAEIHWYEAHGVGRRDLKIKKIVR